ncbi:MAG: type III polyketide synthase [Anaerolineae bacterium]|nr:type III polyketide synthase [Anaerolineae bacterium]
MHTPALVGLTTEVPPSRYSQEEVAEYILSLVGESPRKRAIRAVFERAGVAYRHMILDRQFYYNEQTTKDRNDVYMEAAIELGEKAIRRVLEENNLSPQDIDDFIVVSCTGFSIPGLDLHLAGRLKMRSNLRRTCVLGMGCYGAFPGLQRAREAASQPDKLALVLSVELCSLHFQLEPTAENMVSNSLFSDGAAAALVGGDSYQTGRSPRILDSFTHCDYQTLEHMAFEVTNYGFQMRLSSYVPDLLAAQIEDFVETLLQHNHLAVEDVRFWGIHPGSKKIVDHIQTRLRLADEQVRFSHGVLHDYGNMSSATILFVLERMQKYGQPRAGDYGVLMAFGPGLTMESMLVQW